MTDADGKYGCTVRIVVELRPDRYDQLVRHVRESGSTPRSGCGRRVEAIHELDEHFLEAGLVVVGVRPDAACWASSSLPAWTSSAAALA
jgi:hypothetical protein